MTDTPQDFTSRAEDQEPAKKAYETPELTVHGTIANITEFIGPNSGDGIIGSQVIISDRSMKQDFATVDAHDVLARLVSIPVASWSYHFQNPAIRHIGPMAQDFAAAFGVGENDKHINMVDANGVTIAAIQALYDLVQQRDEQIGELRREIDMLKRKMIQ
ncbi:hypothetical protein CCAX7_27030 [Capsulimonas corticalis]|uniref:Uncharacterized protein n=1 Tax=Capsulimonas corticalis TaxID=2219043 RepID=A0A402CTR0_9BACT|nr:tail fiber domain-containing protein [Capsulimonas corticalis]BDI30652.1 hypothetical protein CCAX7_27030 [Capsulimonas corticalis]